MDKDRYEVRQLVKKLARKYNLTAEEVQKIVDSPYAFTHTKLKDLDLDMVKSRKEAEQLKTNFNYKCFGKLYFSWEAMLTRRKRQAIALELNKNKKNGSKS